MKVLYMHRTRGTGVEGVHINGIVDSMEVLGHEVRVSSPESSDENHADKNSKVDDKPGLKSRFFNLISGNIPELIFEFAELGYNLVSYRKAKHIVREFRPDFIYERYAIFAIVGAMLSKKASIPLVLEINYTSMSPLVRERSRLMSPFAKRVDAWLFKRASCLSVVSSYLRDHLVADYGIPEEKIIVVPNAADPEKFTPLPSDQVLAEKLGLREKTVIGFVGGFYPWHGVSLLLDAFVKIAESSPKAALLLIGDGPERDNIERKVRELSLSDRVIFTGSIPHKELPSYISLFDVGVMPDSNEYGSPMKIFEYMALGKPVVVPDYGPLEDVVVSGEQGVIFERKNVHSLSDALCQIMNNTGLRDSMAKNARNAIESKHNWLRNAEVNLEYISPFCGDEK